MNDEVQAQEALKNHPDLLAVLVELVHHRYADDRRRERRRWIAAMGSLFLAILGGLFPVYLELRRELGIAERQAIAANVQLGASIKEEGAAEPLENEGESEPTLFIPVLRLGEPLQIEVSGATRTVKLEIDRGGEYSIEAIAPDRILDPLIILRSNGLTLAADDDGGDWLNAEIRYTLESGWPYSLVVDELTGTSGVLTLRLRMVVS